jgi:hypothetical protein
MEISFGNIGVRIYDDIQYVSNPSPPPAAPSTPIRRLPAPPTTFPQTYCFVAHRQLALTNTASWRLGHDA